jgi:hypothetical protein
MDSAADTLALAEDAPLLHRAEEISAVVMHSPRPPVGSIAVLAYGEARRSTAVAVITAVAAITAAGDTMVQDLGSASACMRLMGMPLPCVIQRVSTTQTASGSIIPVARFRTGIDCLSSGPSRGGPPDPSHGLRI